MTRPSIKRQPVVVFYDGIAYKSGDAPSALVEDVMVERWAMRVARAVGTGSKWGTVLLRTWFECGFDCPRIFRRITARAAVLVGRE